MTLTHDDQGRLRSIVASMWPVCALVIFAALAVVRELPAGYPRAIVALPIILVVPGALTVSALFGPGRQPRAAVFSGYAVLLSMAWLAFVSLMLYVLHILITASTTYWGLLAVCATFALVAERRLLLETGTSSRQDVDSSQLRSGDDRNASHEEPAAEKSRPFVILGATIAGLCLLFGGVYFYEHAPQPAPVGYTQLAWVNIGKEDTVAAGTAGVSLSFQVIHQESATTHFRLSAAWDETSGHSLSNPIAFTMGPNSTFRGTLFVPSPANQCMYRVVLTMVAIGKTDPLTRRQPTWSLNVNVYKRAASRNTCS